MPQVPIVTSVSPSSGPIAGGQNVTVNGDQFTAQFNPTTPTVTFGGVPATNVAVLGNNNISCKTPAHTTAIVDVSVTTAGGTGTGHNLYTFGSPVAPTVTAVDPPSGSSAGGTSVTITGTAFDEGVSSVTIGGVAATSVAVINPTTIMAFNGAHAVGLFNVVVTTGVGRGTGNNLYTYQTPAPPPPPPAQFHNTYIIERLDNRIWPTVEDCWCVDCGFTLAQPAPNARLTANSATGAGVLTGVTNLVGGKNYSPATTATVVDGNGLGPGTGAVVSLTIVGGVVTAVSFTGGSGYVYPNLVINDPENTGSGASATITMDNSVLFTASAAVFEFG